MTRVGTNDPQAFDLALVDPRKDLVVSHTRVGRNQVFGNTQDTRHFLTVRGLTEIVPAYQVGGVGEKPASHGIRLTGNRVCAGTWPPDISGHKRNVDHGLDSTDALVALIDAHGPPET